MRRWPEEFVPAALGGLPETWAIPTGPRRFRNEIWKVNNFLSVTITMRPIASMFQEDIQRARAGFRRWYFDSGRIPMARYEEMFP